MGQLTFELTTHFGCLKLLFRMFVFVLGSADSYVTLASFQFFHLTSRIISPFLNKLSWEAWLPVIFLEFLQDWLCLQDIYWVHLAFGKINKFISISLWLICNPHPLGEVLTQILCLYRLKFILDIDLLLGGLWDIMSSNKPTHRAGTWLPWALLTNTSSEPLEDPWGLLASLPR